MKLHSRQRHRQSAMSLSILLYSTAATLIINFFETYTGLLRNPKKIHIDLLKFKALKCLENESFISRGLKKVFNFWCSELFCWMCVVKRLVPISICEYFPADNVCTLHTCIRPVPSLRPLCLIYLF